MSGRGLGNQIAVVIIAGCALIAAPAVRAVLPGQFLMDDAHLQDSIAGRIPVGDSEGFAVTAALYRTLGLADRPSATAVLAMIVFTVAVFVAIGWDRLRELTIIGLAAVGASYVLALAYLAQYSKELVTLVLALLVLVLPRDRERAWAWDLVVVAGCLVYAVTLREYWAVIAGMYVVWRIALAWFRHPALLLLVPVASYIALTPAFQIVLGGGLQSQREWSNAERAGTAGDVASLIQSPFPGAEGVLGIVSALIMLALLIVPLTLAASGSAYHLASAGLIAAIWFVILTPVARGLLARRPAVLGVQASRAAALLLAALVVQALFEPDYGSYLKHLTPLLPLALAMLPAAALLRPAETFAGVVEPASVAARPRRLARAGGAA
ncbi:hypothetical protein ACT3TZ_02510 [Brachybacterium sp. AOP25-B2-12]|uniref:hypothetical protein n=1 Tax=Brachybacterium sp. AOP25-B2-12 TaxID=3457710 RepID=UPI004033D9EE